MRRVIPKLDNFSSGCETNYLSKEFFKEEGKDSAKNYKLVLLSPMGMNRIKDANCGGGRGGVEVVRTRS